MPCLRTVRTTLNCFWILQGGQFGKPHEHGKTPLRLLTRSNAAKPIVFLTLGVGAGLAALFTGFAWRTSLALSGGFFFAVALLIAILISNGSQAIRWHPVRYSIALLACVPAYILVVFASASVSQYLAGVLHLAPMANLEDGRLDMALGVLIASWLAGFFVEILNAILIGSWSWMSLGICLLLGSAAVVLSLLVNALYHSYWVFVGTLLVTAQALFLWQVGRSLGRRND